MKRFFILFLVVFASFSVKAQLSGDKKTEFNKLIREADVLFSQNKFLEAKLAYEKALAIDPADSYALNQRDKSVANSKDDKRDEDKNYQKIINKADEKFNASDYQNAKTLYQRALGLKPNDPYPKRKIDEIDALLNPKPVKKSDPLPDLGINSGVSVVDAEKILKEAELKRQNIRSKALDSNNLKFTVDENELNNNRNKEMSSTSSNIKGVGDKIELNTINTKAEQDSLNREIQKKESRLSDLNENFKILQTDKGNNATTSMVVTNYNLDSLASIKKTAGAEMDVFIAIKTKRFSDSVAIAEQKMKDDMAYKIMEINLTNQKDEKKYADNEITKQQINELVLNTNINIEENTTKTSENNQKDIYLLKEEVSEIDKKINEKETEEIKNYANNKEGLNPNLSKNVIKGDSLAQLPTQNAYNTADRFSKIDGKSIDSLSTLNVDKKYNQSNQILAIEKVFANDHENNILVRDEAANRTQEGIKKLKEDNSNIEKESKENQDKSIEVLKNVEKQTSDFELSSSQKETEQGYASMDQIKTSESKVLTSGAETNVKNGENALTISGKSNVLSGNSSIEDQKQNDKKQDVRDFLENMDSKNVKFDEKASNSIGATYPEGVTEESFNKLDDQGLPYAVITRRIVVVNGHGSIYTRTQTLNTITYSKNGQSTTEYVWQLETQDAKLKRN
jgi:epidermal growth factor receptor substrate 15